MKRKPTTVRAAALLAAVVTSVLALALAGTAAAHNGGDGHDHFGDREPAGTIASFDPDTGALTIDLTSGGTASGTVTRFTWIGCGHHWWWSHHRGHARRAFHHHFGGDDHGWPGRHCSTDDLTPGAVVDDALLVLGDGGATFWKIELAVDEEQPTT